MNIRVAALLIGTAIAPFLLSARASAEAGAKNPLPGPTGPYAVGRIEYDWTDESLHDPLSAKNAVELEVYVWYPAIASASAMHAPYFSQYTAFAQHDDPSDLKDDFGPSVAAFRAGTLLSHSYAGAEVSPAAATYPLLLFSPGWGFQSLQYSAQAEDLASHGYIVVAVDHPYDTTLEMYADGRVLPFAQAEFDRQTKTTESYIAYGKRRVDVMAAENRFVLERLATIPLARHMDFSRIAAFGHSIGGLASARTCQLDARVRACMDEDSDYQGTPFDGASERQPFLLWVVSSADEFSRATVSPSDAELKRLGMTRAAYDAHIRANQKAQNEALGAVAGGSLRLFAFNVPGFRHRNFSDELIFDDQNEPVLLAQDIAIIGIVRRYDFAFFERVLRNRVEPPLVRDQAHLPVPDVQVQVQCFNASC